MLSAGGEGGEHSQSGAGRTAHYVQQKERKNRYLDIGVRGRKTGWMPPSDIAVDELGMADPEDYFRDLDSADDLSPDDNHDKTETGQNTHNNEKEILGYSPELARRTARPSPFRKSALVRRSPVNSTLVRHNGYGHDDVEPETEEMRREYIDSRSRSERISRSFNSPRPQHTPAIVAPDAFSRRLSGVLQMPSGREMNASEFQENRRFSFQPSKQWNSPNARYVQMQQNEHDSKSYRGEIYENEYLDDQDNVFYEDRGNAYRQYQERRQYPPADRFIPQPRSHGRTPPAASNYAEETTEFGPNDRLHSSRRRSVLPDRNSAQPQRLQSPHITHPVQERVRQEVRASPTSQSLPQFRRPIASPHSSKTVRSGFSAAVSDSGRLESRHRKSQLGVNVSNADDAYASDEERQNEIVRGAEVFSLPESHAQRVVSSARKSSGPIQYVSDSRMMESIERRRREDDRRFRTDIGRARGSSISSVSVERHHRDPYDEAVLDKTHFTEQQSRGVKQQAQGLLNNDPNYSFADENLDRASEVFVEESEGSGELDGGFDGDERLHPEKELSPSGSALNKSNRKQPAQSVETLQMSESRDKNWAYPLLPHDAGYTPPVVPESSPLPSSPAPTKSVGQPAKTQTLNGAAKRSLAKKISTDPKQNPNTRSATGKNRAGKSASKPNSAAKSHLSDKGVAENAEQAENAQSIGGAGNFSFSQDNFDHEQSEGVDDQDNRVAGENLQSASDPQQTDSVEANKHDVETNNVEEQENQESLKTSGKSAVAAKKRGRPPTDKTATSSTAPKKIKVSKKPESKLAPAVEHVADGTREKRNRMAPLKFWAGEQPEYKASRDPLADTIVLELKGIKEETTVEDARKIQTTAKSYSRTKAKPKKKHVILHNPEMPVFNHETQSDENIRCVYTEDMLDPQNVHSESFKYQRTFTVGDFMGAGVIEIPKGGLKPNKSTGSAAVVFYIVNGLVRVRLHKNVFEIGENAQFLVPRYNQYSIENIGRDEARLIFMQSRVSQAASTATLGPPAVTPAAEEEKPEKLTKSKRTSKSAGTKGSVAGNGIVRASSAKK